jgi:hypothetical protein
MLQRHRGAVRVDPHVAGVQAVVRPEAAGRTLHVLAEPGLHACLVDDHVRELREAVLDVLHPPGPRDPAPVGGVGAPERDLVDPVGLGHEPVGQPEGLEHLHGAAGHAVGLAHLERPVPAVDDRRPDVGEGGQLGRQDQAGRAASDDQDVDLGGQAVGTLGDGGVRRLDQRVAGPVTVHVELHD